MSCGTSVPRVGVYQIQDSALAKGTDLRASPCPNRPCAQSAIQLPKYCVARTAGPMSTRSEQPLGARSGGTIAVFDDMRHHGDGKTWTPLSGPV